MSTKEQLNKLIRDTVNDIVGTVGYAVRAKQKDAPRPSGPYASVDFMTSVSTGWDSVKYMNKPVQDLDVTLEGSRNGTFQIDFFREGAHDNARQFITALQRPSVVSSWNAAGAGLVSVSDAKDLSEALNSGWEERATVTLTLNYVYSDVSTVESIESIDISVNVDGYGNTLPITNT